MKLDVSPERRDALLASLSPDERARAARMRFAQLQQRFITAHGGLRELLGCYLDVNPGDIEFIHNDFDKPALSERFGGRLRFNLSHSAGLALVAIALDAEVGVDVEWIRQEAEFHDIAQWMLAAGEAEQLGGLSSELRTRAFLACWTRKEAYIKARGQGLGRPSDMAPTTGWSLYSLQPAPGYVGALVVEGSGRRVAERSVEHFGERCTQGKKDTMSGAFA